MLFFELVYNTYNTPFQHLRYTPTYPHFAALRTRTPTIRHAPDPRTTPTTYRSSTFSSLPTHPYFAALRTRIQRPQHTVPASLRPKPPRATYYVFWFSPRSFLPSPLCEQTEVRRAPAHTCWHGRPPGAASASAASLYIPSALPAGVRTRRRARGPLLIFRKRKKIKKIYILYEGFQPPAHRAPSRSPQSPLAAAATVRRAPDSDLVATATAEAAWQRPLNRPPTSAAAQLQW